MESTSVMIAARVSKREARIIERVAKSQKLTVSAYLRAAGLSVCVLDGDIEAIKYMGGIAVQRLTARAKELLREDAVRQTA